MIVERVNNVIAYLSDQCLDCEQIDDLIEVINFLRDVKELLITSKLRIDDELIKAKIEKTIELF